MAIGSTFLLVSIPILINFLKLDSFKSFYKNFQHIHDYASLNGGSSINLLDSSYFERFFLVLFRPLFFDAYTFFQYCISLENLLMIILLIALLYRKVDFFKISQPIAIKFSFYTSVLLILFLRLYCIISV